MAHQPAPWAYPGTHDDGMGEININEEGFAPPAQRPHYHGQLTLQ